jgi:hypothetical protein
MYKSNRDESFELDLKPAIEQALLWLIFSPKNSYQISPYCWMRENRIPAHLLICLRRQISLVAWIPSWPASACQFLEYLQQLSTTAKVPQHLVEILN